MRKVHRHPRSDSELAGIARGQRHLILTVTIASAVFFATFTLPTAMLFAMGWANRFYFWHWTFWMSVVFGWGAIMVSAMRLAQLSGLPHGVRWALAAPLLFPPTGIVVLLYVNARVTAILERGRLSVGELGVARRTIAHLDGVSCLGCGYDIRGLRAEVCPECGKAMDRHDRGRAPAGGSNPDRRSIRQ